LPQIESAKNASQKSRQVTSPLASSSSSSLSSTASIGKRKKVYHLANQLRKCTIQSTTSVGLRNLSYRFLHLILVS